MQYFTSKEVAESWKISSRRVTTLCKEGRVDGAVLKGNTWLIPDSTKKPEELQRGRKKNPND